MIPLAWNACSQGPLGLGNGDSATLTVAPLNGTGTLDSASLKQSFDAIVTTNCSACHMSTSGQGNVYNLTDTNHLLSAGLIVRGQPAQSLLYSEIITNSMPPGSSLSASDKAVVRDWIISLAATPTPTPTTTPRPGASPTPVPSATPRPNVSFADLQATIFDPKCTGCHGGANPDGQLDLTTYDGVMTKVNLASPTSSLLYTEVKSGAMPKDGPALSTSDVNKILYWIQNGAPNN